MNNIVASFSNDTAFNDYYVHSFVCRNSKKCAWKRENSYTVLLFRQTNTHTHTHTHTVIYESLKPVN